MRTMPALLTALMMVPLAAHGTPALRDAAGPYRLEVLVDGQPAPTFEHRGETWVLGHLGERYTLRIVNGSPQRVEAVVSVDGRDVVDGRPGDLRGRRGYLVPAWGSVDIDGWRVSQSQAAAFRFSTVAASYSARMGSDRDVGVIGLAVFPERPVYVPRPQPIYPRFPGRPGEPWGSRGGDEQRLDRSAPHGSAAPPASPQAGAKARSGAAESAGAMADGRAAERPGLGTEYGEAVASAVQEVEFVRANAAHPAALLGVRYDDRAGLMALGIPVDQPAWDREAELRTTAEPFPASRWYSVPPAGWRR